MSLALFDTLFGSKARARTLRFFLLNPGVEYSAADVAAKTMVSKKETTKEIQRLVKMKFLFQKLRKGKKTYVLNENFPFHTELQSLVSKLNVHAQSQIFRKLKTVGEVKLILISGIFINYPKSKVDMILVVNNENPAKMKRAISYLEAEVGKEIRYFVMTSEDLHYRLNMLDRFFKEFLEGPYEEVVNKVPELKRFIAGLKK